jgi:hypothetical protein
MCNDETIFSRSDVEKTLSFHFKVYKYVTEVKLLLSTH